MTALPSLRQVFLPYRPFRVLGIHISEYVYSMACLNITSNYKRPKRPGGDYSILAVAQSYRGSHTEKISARWKSSTYAGISLDPSLYQIVSLNLPQQIPLSEQVPTFRYALEELGFNPLERWEWDIRLTDSGYQVLICSKARMQTIMQDFAIPKGVIAYLGPTDNYAEQRVSPLLSAPQSGPWLHQTELEHAVHTALFTAKLTASINKRVLHV